MNYKLVTQYILCGIATTDGLLAMLFLMLASPFPQLPAIMGGLGLVLLLLATLLERKPITRATPQLFSLFRIALILNLGALLLFSIVFGAQLLRG